MLLAFELWHVSSSSSFAALYICMYVFIYLHKAVFSAGLRLYQDASILVTIFILRTLILLFASLCQVVCRRVYTFLFLLCVPYEKI